MVIFKNSFVNNMMVVGVLIFSFMNDVDACSGSYLDSLTQEYVASIQAELKPVCDSIEEFAAQKGACDALFQAGDVSQQAALTLIETELGNLRNSLKTQIANLRKYQAEERKKRHLGNFGFVFVTHLEDMTRTDTKCSMLQYLVDRIDAVLAA